jgi:MerR HTH family regulatory protein
MSLCATWVAVYPSPSQWAVLMRLGIERKQGHLPNGSIKIGAVAGRFGISVDLLRLYEREGLLIPIKSPRGTRYFTAHDFPWIAMILRLVRESRMNLAAIRHLLTALPCWQIRHCGFESRQGCPVISDESRPCWSNRATCPVVCAQDCYFCPVYRSAPGSEQLRAQLRATPSAPPTPQAAAD